MLCFITTRSEPHNVRAICFWLYRSALLTNASYVAQDILVMKDAEHPEWMWGASISEVDGRYLFLDIVRDTGKVCARRFSCFTGSLN